MGLAIAIILICLMISLITSKNIFSPAVIVSALWLFCLVLYWLYPHHFVKLNGNFYKSITLWVSFFTFFSLFSQSLKFKSNHSNEPDFRIRNLFFFISIISFPFAVFKIYNMLSQLGITTNILYNLRLAATGSLKGVDEETSRNYFATLWLITLAIEILHFDKKRILHIIFLVFINSVWAILVMSKIVFLSIFATILTILFFKKVIKPKILLISGIVLFGFFVILQIARTPNAKNVDDLKYDFISQYLLTSLPAFEKIKPESAPIKGENTFRFYFAFNYRLGLSDIKPVETIHGFVDVGSQNAVYTNVYSVLYPYYKDFGNKGIVIFAIISGLFFGFIYKKATIGNNPMLICYALFIGGIICQFMNENLFTTLSLNIQILILSHLPYWTKNFKFKRANNQISSQ